MSCEKIKITDGFFSVEKFIDVDTRRSHDIIVYRYAINGDLGHNMVIGECFTNEENIIPYLQKLMNFRITHASMPFIYGTVKFMKDFNIFDLILLSEDGYNLLFNPEFLIAECTLSLASLTALSGSPTMLIFGSELITSTSTSILWALIPSVVAVIDFETIRWL